MNQYEGLLKDVVGVCEATSFEKLCLWQEYKSESDWIDFIGGYGVTVGRLHGHPVVISITAATINGRKILFIEDTSRVVDHAIIEDWLNANLPKSAWNGEFYNRSDAMNFHNLLRST